MFARSSTLPVRPVSDFLESSELCATGNLATATSVRSRWRIETAGPPGRIRLSPLEALKESAVPQSLVGCPRSAW
jgi:hypothetical protein